MQRKFSNFYKTLFILFAAFCLPFLGIAQQNQFELSWRTGTLVLTSGDTIRGPITLTLPNDIVRITQADGGVSTFTAVNVKGFAVEGEQETSRFFQRRRNSPLDFKREYRSLMWNHDKDYSNFKSPAFFVVLQSGPKTLLMRETLERRVDNFSPYANYPGSRQAVETRVEKFYLLTADDRIIPLRSPKKDLPAAYPKKEKQIAAFAKSNKLEFNDPIELSRIVAYANSLP
ncbi:hypothetical protein I5M27_04690 [Adhaeribacter sp. BT258]|uniref:DUF4369 domain-containing protein n=1 Tax=Adhaeribacter terrigena TaxID=2793070 RepID=A0ABS1BYW3_9BACT|nr:hypothetical protein [Adhaeribacter terrigena]MBK0402269.1 hypothetical protein [Adhaeribacter terrigena]